MQLATRLAKFVGSNWKDARLLERLPSHQNLVFAGTTDGADVIVRCTPDTHRTRAWIEDELQWMLHLKSGGVCVPGLIVSLGGKYLETATFGAKLFHVAILERVPGVPLSTPRLTDELTAARWGRMIGRMNRNSTEFEHREPFRWAGDRTGVLALSPYLTELGDAPPSVAESLARVESRTRTNSSYGLVHADCHSDNVLLHEKQVYAFDFDECCFHWRMVDIANPIFSLYFDSSRQRKDTGQFKDICSALIGGFETEFPEISAELPLLPDFVVYRMGLLLAWTSDLGPAPRWLSNCTDEWKHSLREWSLDELRSVRIRDMLP